MGSCDFKWGNVKSKGKKPGVQFYDSFIYDGMQYFLHDCVYLYTEEEAQPDIGKLVKIWEEPDNKKRVKVVWFFRPSELGEHLKGDVQYKEIFLASGQGVGLSNVNDLEVINGKCNIVCTSKDHRNPPASAEELEMADYIFYRTFDVGKLRISDDIEDFIAGVDVRYFFNRKKTQQFVSVPMLQANLEDKHIRTGLTRPSTVKEVGRGEIDRNARTERSPHDEQTDKGGDHRSTSPVRTISRADNGIHKDVYKAGKGFHCRVKNEVGQGSVRDSKDLKISQNIPFKENDRYVDSAKSLKKNGTFRIADKRKNSVRNVSEDNKGWSCRSDIGSSQHKRKSNEDLSGEHRKKISCERENEDFDLECYAAQRKNIATDCQELDVSKRSVDKSKWFKYTWEEKLEDAYKKGSAVLFDGLNPSYTSDEVEEILLKAFNVQCTAKVIPGNELSIPRSGQALAIFETKQRAEDAINKCQNGCCMLEDGRILVASHHETPREYKEQSKFYGHLSLSKVILRHGAEKRMAVSTSHFPQPNTIEYEMAAEWIKLETQSERQREELYQMQQEELENVRSQLRTLSAVSLVQHTQPCLFFLHAYTYCLQLCTTQDDFGNAKSDACKEFAPKSIL